MPTMNCERFSQLRRDYLEGSLEEATCLLLQRHADQCASCGASLLADLALPAQWEQSLLGDLAPSLPERWQAGIEALLPAQPDGVRDECYLMWPDLSALLDGELDPAERRAARAHTRECHPCAGELRAMGRLDRGLRDLRATPPTSLRPALCVLTGDRRFGAHAVSRRNLLWLSSAAAAVALFALGMGALNVVFPGERPRPGALQVAASPVAQDAEKAPAELPADKSAEPSSSHGTDPRTVASYDTSAAMPRTAEVARKRGSRRGSVDMPDRRTGGAVALAVTNPGAIASAVPSGTALQPETVPDAAVAQASSSGGPLGLELDGWGRVVAGLQSPGSDSGTHNTAPRGPMVVDAVAVPVSSGNRVDVSFEPAASAGLY